MQLQSSVTIFYHCHPINDYQARLASTWEKIVDSGLIDKADSFKLIMNGPGNCSISHEKIEMITVSQHSNESMSANRIKRFAKKYRGYILYLHSKGVTKPEQTNIRSWVDCMEYFLIEKHDECIKALESYKACGIFPRKHFNDEPHFSGNFWWARNNYLATLPDCDTGDYHGCEKWHLSGCKDSDYLTFYDLPSRTNLYKQTLNRDMYKQSVLPQVLSWGSDNLYVFGGLFEGGIHLQQDPYEITELIEYLISKGIPINRILEVGSASGGNSFVFAKLLSPNEIFIIDDNQHTKHVYRKDLLQPFNVSEFIGDSHSAEAIDFANQNGPYDMIYIDADHSYRGVMEDAKNYSKLLCENGYLIFHDTKTDFDKISGPGRSKEMDGGPQRVVRKLVEDGAFRVIFSTYRKFGIDLLQKKKRDE
ncbi:MAG: class I SAM-dependent methyltransferase [Planctomycetota bacterium]